MSGNMNDKSEPKTISGRDARQGDIIIRTPMRKAIFIAGLAGFIILTIIAFL